MPKRKRDIGNKSAPESEDWARFNKSGKKADKSSRMDAPNSDAKALGPFPDHTRPSEPEARVGFR